MEKMPYRDGDALNVHAAIAGALDTTTTSDWRQALPVLTGTMVTLSLIHI